MIESELFGHEAGAFSGRCARAMAVSSMRAAARSCSTRSARCRWICRRSCCACCRSGLITRLGSNDLIPLDVRFIATSKPDLAAKVEAGTFREDLYWRLNVAMVQLPALSARREDIRRCSCISFERPPPATGRRPNAGLPNSWPNSPRATGGQCPRTAQCGRALCAGSRLDAGRAGRDRPAPGRTVGRVRARVIAGAIAAHRGHLRPVYESLGISRKTLYEKMLKHGLGRHLPPGPDEGDEG